VNEHPVITTRRVVVTLPGSFGDVLHGYAAFVAWWTPGHAIGAAVLAVVVLAALSAPESAWAALAELRLRVGTLVLALALAGLSGVSRFDLAVGSVRSAISWSRRRVVPGEER
jgi:hypothetical protein